MKGIFKWDHNAANFEESFKDSDARHGQMLLALCLIMKAVMDPDKGEHETETQFGIRQGYMLGMIAAFSNNEPRESLFVQPSEVSVSRMVEKLVNEANDERSLIGWSQATTNMITQPGGICPKCGVDHSKEEDRCHARKEPELVVEIKSTNNKSKGTKIREIKLNKDGSFDQTQLDGLPEEVKRAVLKQVAEQFGPPHDWSI